MDFIRLVEAEPLSSVSPSHSLQKEIIENNYPLFREYTFLSVISLDALMVDSRYFHTNIATNQKHYLHLFKLKAQQEFLGRTESMSGT